MLKSNIQRQHLDSGYSRGSLHLLLGSHVTCGVENLDTAQRHTRASRERCLIRSSMYKFACMDGWTRPCQVRTARFTLLRVATIRRLGRSRSREVPLVGTRRSSSTLGLLLRRPAHSLIARCAAQGAQTRGLARQSFPSRSPLAAPPAG